MGEKINYLIIYFTITFLKVTLATRRATPCNDRHPLLNGEIVDLKVPFHLRDNRITSSPSIYSGSEGDGWCAQSMCTVESENYYLQVDFGAEVVVEAISITRSISNNHYQVTEYQVEYGSDLNYLYCVTSEESNDNIFAVDICRGNQDTEVKNFTYPVIAQFIRVVLLQWENELPCFRMELYGCYVKECNQINLIPVNFSSVSVLSNMNVWCTGSIPAQIATVNFTEPVYLLYAVISRNGNFDVTRFSLSYENSSNASVPYVNVDGINLFGEEYDPDDHHVLLWIPINTTRIQLTELEDTSSFSCVGINFYGCTYSEVIDHEFSVLEATTETINPTSVITLTTSVNASFTTTIPQSSCSCSDQQQTSASSSSDSNVVIITVPIVVVFGVIVVIVIVVIGILIWRKIKSRSDTLPYDKVSPATAEVTNDLYGMGAALNSKSLENNNEASNNGAQGDRKDSVTFATVTRPNQPTVTYETVSLHEEDGTRSSNKAAASNVYSEPSDLHSDPQL